MLHHLPKIKMPYIVGGTGVISALMEVQINSFGITCIRIAGQNRYVVLALKIVWLKYIIISIEI